ncbi:type II toxin-antitoxin system Phd/YefM family antitoxin [uncultured Sutterella sp.]|uniref:type II toxin-antitoxin system Phd/YefM family antitoxin n=1 Tax=uncultured Sutterella sp. TaxID=286133 RepID=UPI002623F697|nr:type II toxin-antitoxin system Phd/YefM family antitoxin [uncultured Sutterella sp.]
MYFSLQGVLMESLSISDARKNLSSIIQALNSDNPEPVRINVRGKTVAVLLSSEEYERMRRQILDQEIDAIFNEFHDANAALTSK